MKKIFYINGTTALGGGPEHLYQLLKRVDTREWQPVICTQNDGPFWTKFCDLKFTTYALATREISLITLYRLITILKKEKPDLIHSHGKGPGLYGRIAGWLLGIPVIHTFHGFHYEDLPSWQRFPHLLVENFLALITRHHIFVGEGELERARVLRLLNRNSMSIIHNGVEFASIRNYRPDREKVLNSIGLQNPYQYKIIGTVARISPEKGISDLIDGFGEVLKSQPGMKLLIIGGAATEHSKYFSNLKQRVLEKNLEKDILFLGYRQDAQQIIKCIDVFISSSLSEGLPISLLEAYAAGVPIVATKIRGNKDVIRNSIYGVLTQPGSPESLAKGILKMFSMSPKERNILIQNGYKRVKEHFSVESMALETFSLYKQVL